MASNSGSSTLELRDAEERYRHSSNNLHFSPAKPVKSGGLHVTISKCVLLIMLCVIAIVAVAIIVFVAARRTDDVVSVTSLSKDLWTICEGLTLARNECMNTEPCTRSQQSDELAPYKPVSYVTDVRLTDDVIPEHYDLELRPDFYSSNMADFRSYGHVSIRVHCQRATSRIRLHVNALNISMATVTDAADGQEKPLKQDGGVSEDKLRQFLELRLNEPLEADHKYLINLTFSGPLKDDLDGMYVSSYKRGNDTVWLVVTQMEPTDARKAFPCFDEPAFKATFDVTLVRKRNMTSLSNTFITSSEERGNDWIADRYATSLKMSTYLIAFMVCDFEYTELTTTNGVQFRVWARPDAVNQTGYALGIGVRILDHFVDYFNITYPMTKMDMVAVPDFSAGAMENWGLIIYRETALLYDPRESSTRNKQRVAVVIAHELAHQWFGNIVTMDWWDDLWLNEGFASFVEYIGTDHVEPSWKMYEQFILEELQYVMDADGLASSHPIYIPVNHPDEISQIFDIISYSKGASVIRMLNHILGEATFRRGLTRYLTSRRFQNAKHDHLWSALDQQAKEDGVAVNVKVVMDTWLLQMGYPLVTLSRNPFSPGDIQVTQTHFLLDTQQTPSSKYPSQFGYKWEVPVTYVTDVAVNSPQVIWLHKTNETIRNANPTMNWILGNVGAYGYYRVNYDTNNWVALIQQLISDHKVIPTINRAQIIDDAFNIGRSGRIDQVIGLQTTKYLMRETEYLPWQAATDNLGYFDVMLQRSNVYGLYQQYILQQIRPHYTRLGWGSTVTGHLDKYMKITVLELACHYGLPTCASNATALYHAYMTNPSNNPIEADLRYIVYCTAIRDGDVAEWDFAYSKYKTSNVAAEKTRLLAALSCSRQTWILSRYLRYILDSKEIRKQDIAQVVVGVASNPIGRPLAWDFFRANWNLITERIQSGIFLLQSLTKRIASGFNTPFELQQMDNFRRSQSTLGRTSTAYEQAMEKTRLNIRWMNDNEKKIGDWLALNTAKY